MEKKEGTLLNISNIYFAKGENKKFWKKLLYDIISNDRIIIFNIVSELFQSLKKNNNLELSIYIIDFIMDYGSESIIESITKEEFLYYFTKILSNKYETKEENKKLVLYLIQKWTLDKGKKYVNLQLSYDKLKNKGIIFPSQNIEFETYQKFISSSEILEIINNRKININEYKEKTIYQNPFLDISKNKSSSKLDIINNLKNNKLYVNEPAPPIFCRGNILNLINMNNNDINNNNIFESNSNNRDNNENKNQKSKSPIYNLGINNDIIINNNNERKNKDINNDKNFENPNNNFEIHNNDQLVKKDNNNAFINSSKNKEIDINSQKNISNQKFYFSPEIYKEKINEEKRNEIKIETPKIYSTSGGNEKKNEEEISLKKKRIY